jgi:hypothetical protein
VSGEHQTLVLWLVIGTAWLLYAVGMKAGLFRRPPKSARQALAAMVLLLYATFIPLPGLMPEADLHGGWLAVSIANVACAALGAAVLLLVRGEGEPMRAHAYGSLGFALYLAGALLAIAVVVGAAELRMKGGWTASSIKQGVIGYLIVAVTFIVASLHLRRRARA